jgi:hypothetical protein
MKCVCVVKDIHVVQKSSEKTMMCVCVIGEGHEYDF